MDEADITARLTRIFRDIFDDDELELRPDMTADEVDGWDSLRHVRLVLTVEKAFGTRFPASEVANLKNVGELVALIGRRTQGTAQSAAAP